MGMKGWVIGFGSELYEKSQRRRPRERLRVFRMWIGQKETRVGYANTEAIGASADKGNQVFGTEYEPWKRMLRSSWQLC